MGPNIANSVVCKMTLKISIFLKGVDILTIDICMINYRTSLVNSHPNYYQMAEVLRVGKTWLGEYKKFEHIRLGQRLKDFSSHTFSIHWQPFPDNLSKRNLDFLKKKQQSRGYLIKLVALCQEKVDSLPSMYE